MKHLFRLMIIFPVFVLIFLPDISLSAKSQKTALVIGNGAYNSSPLRNPVNDATDMSSMLKKLGFKVILKTNANQRTMENSIRNFGRKLYKGGVGLFYYAGHAIQVHGTNYLLPIDAQIESESDVKYEAIDAGRVLGKMEDAGNGLNIIILDSCRDNPFARSFRTSEKGLAKMDAPTGSILAYSTAPGSIAADGAGRNGLYTSRLLSHMATPGLEIGRVFRKVRIDVVGSSQKKQVPWESSSLMGEFYFNPKRGIAIVKPTQNLDAALKAEQEQHEPWTGTWKVTGYVTNVVLKLKQSGNTVKSIRGSDRKFKGKVIGDHLKGRHFSNGWEMNSNFKIANDFKSFQGVTNSYVRDFNVRGKRQE